MNRRAVEAKTLSAYVDGELSPAEAARVARAIAEDRDLATRVAVLARLKSVVAQTPRAPVHLLDAPPRRPPYRRLAMATAATVLAVVALTVWQQPGGPDDALQAKLQDAGAAHRAWVQAWHQGPWIRDVAAVAEHQVRVGNGSARIPDLSRAGLHFAQVQPLDGSGALHIGYQGEHGCMVSLVVHADGSAFPPTLEARLEGRSRTYLWRAGASGYLMMASGMAPARLEVLARTVFEVIRDQAPLDEQAISRLVASRHQLPPCTA